MMGGRRATGDMGSWARPYAFARLTSAFIAVSAALALGCGVFAAKDAPTPEPTLDLIAYATTDGRINTMSPDGSNQVKISPDDGFFTWPIWSPDGNAVAFSGSSSGSDLRGRLRLYVYYIGDQEPAVLYTNEPDLGPILNGMPHYPIWAPDSQRLAFMASVPEGLTLFLTDPKNRDGELVVIRNAPLYASWSSDSRYLLVHGGRDHFVIDFEEGMATIDLVARTSSYRAPAWWPAGNRMTFVSEAESGGRGLYLTDPDGGNRVLLDQVPGEVAFLWSPDGGSLAVAHSDTAGAFVYQGINLFAPDGTRRSVGTDEDVFAFFWSPDSTKLAYVTWSGSPGVLRWIVLDVLDGSRWPLVDFKPSGAQVAMFAFFDQFAYSHSLWSPDSRSLVFAGGIAGGAAPASLNRQSVSRIIVADVQPNSSVGPVAEGFLAVWSPR